MSHAIRAIQRAADATRIANVPFDKPEFSAQPIQPINIRMTTGRKIIQTNNLIAPLQKFLSQIRADKPCDTRD